jgi:hypothetical protein
MPIQRTATIVEMLIFMVFKNVSCEIKIMRRKKGEKEKILTF